ncbi:MAG TPA: Rieske (2Fe-2S) protein [Chloroflexota bacterium]|nr:Rieske (2Fe-2S) protein [Chloroflexota bacterium]
MSDEINRRQFLGRLSIALGALAGAVVGIPIIAYLLSPLIHPAVDLWRTVGPVSKFLVGETVQVTYTDPSPLPWAGLTAETAAWVRRNSIQPGDFTVFAINCTHLGCPVNWIPDGQIFLCPCHGGVFYADGSVAAGPPQRPLFRYRARVESDQLQILTRPLPVA